MGWEARRNKDRASLPEHEWQCIWCDASPPVARFRRREHVIPESLGGPRNFRLLRGVVCDACNGGALKDIDDELNLNPWVRGLRVFFGLGTPFREVRPGIRRDGDIVTVTNELLGNRDRVELNLVRGGGGTFTIGTSGPSEKARPEHFARGLHRMAFNAIAHFDGCARTREFLHLREYVLADVDQVPMRAYLLDEKTLNASLRTTAPWIASCELLRDEKGSPQIVFLRLGALYLYVSVEKTTRPLAALRSKFSWLRVAGEIDA